MNYLVSTEPLKDFTPTVEASGCYCEHQNTILFLKRAQGVPQGNTWGVPGGKHEKGEDSETAVVRELFEETGLHVGGSGLDKLGKLYVRMPQVDYIFHVFRKRFTHLPKLHLRLEENVESKWVTLEEAYQLPLIYGGKEALDYYQSKTLKFKV